jgi:hypothetical protein
MESGAHSTEHTETDARSVERIDAAFAGNTRSFQEEETARHVAANRKILREVVVHSEICADVQAVHRCVGWCVETPSQRIAAVRTDPNIERADRNVERDLTVDLPKIERGQRREPNARADG